MINTAKVQLKYLLYVYCLYNSLDTNLNNETIKYINEKLEEKYRMLSPINNENMDDIIKKLIDSGVEKAEIIGAGKNHIVVYVVTKEKNGIAGHFIRNEEEANIIIKEQKEKE